MATARAEADPEGHLERAAVGVEHQVARRLVGAGDHDPIITEEAPAARASATSRGWRTPPSAHTCLPCSRAAAAHSRTAELAGPAGHHPGRAHRARAHADLDDVGARLDQRAGALGGRRCRRRSTARSATGRVRPARACTIRSLVLVRGVHDEQSSGRTQFGVRLATSPSRRPQRRCAGHRTRPAPVATASRAGRRAGQHATSSPLRATATASGAFAARWRRRPRRRSMSERGDGDDGRFITQPTSARGPRRRSRPPRRPGRAPALTTTAACARLGDQRSASATVGRERSSIGCRRRGGAADPVADVCDHWIGMPADHLDAAASATVSAIAAGDGRHARRRRAAASRRSVEGREVDVVAARHDDDRGTMKTSS